MPDVAGTTGISGEGDWLLGDAERGDVWTRSPDGVSLVSWLEGPPFDAGREGMSCWVGTDEGTRVVSSGGSTETVTTGEGVGCPAVTP